MQFVLVEFEFEVVEVDDVSDFEIEGEIFFLSAPDIDLQGFTLVGVVDDFNFLGEVSVLFVAVGTGCVDNESSGRVESIRVVGLFIFLVLFFGLLKGENLSVLVHNS